MARLLRLKASMLAVQMDTLRKVENSSVPVVSINVNLQKEDRDLTDIPWREWDISGCLWPEIMKSRIWD